MNFSPEKYTNELQPLVKFKKLILPGQRLKNEFQTVVKILTNEFQTVAK